MFYTIKRYVPAAERRRKAAQQIAKLKKSGHAIAPVLIEGRAIANTFWGKSWCENLERYGDYANRLPRGRTYVRNGSVLDLQIDEGAIAARVSGSALYEVTVKIAAVPTARWNSLVSDCAGEIDSLVELLQGHLSQAVMQRMCKQDSGLFPAPKEISFDCSCPDWANMCKHVAAVLYGVGARLDERPELLFSLRAVKERDLIAKAGTGLRSPAKKPKREKVLATSDLSGVFGIDFADEAPRTQPRSKTQRDSTKSAPRKRVERARRGAASR